MYSTEIAGKLLVGGVVDGRRDGWEVVGRRDGWEVVGRSDTIVTPAPGPVELEPKPTGMR